MEEHHARRNHREWKAALETVQRHSEFFSLHAFWGVSSPKIGEKTPQISKNGSITPPILREVKFAICPDIIGNLANLAKNWFLHAKWLIDIYIYHVFEVLKGHFTGRRAEQDHNGKQQSKTTDIQEWFLLFHNRPANQGNCFSNGTRPMINHTPITSDIPKGTL